MIGKDGIGGLVLQTADGGLLVAAVDEIEAELLHLLLRV